MTAAPAKALLLINPSSRSGAEADLIHSFKALNDAGIELIQVQSRSADHACEEIRKHRELVDFVIFGGGDGTISSAAKCLYDTGLAFAILPLGTANDLARSLDIPDDIEQAIQIIVENHRRMIDLGCVNEHLFFNVANIGLGVNITYELTPEVKKTWGVLSYLKALLCAIARTESFPVTLLIDEKKYRTRSIHLGVGNGRYYGGGNVIDEYCTIDNGLLSLYSLKPQSLWELLSLAPLLRGGKQYRTQRTFTAYAKRIEVRTATRMEVHADGEPVTFTPATFKVIPKALQVIAPSTVPDHSKPDDHTKPDERIRPDSHAPKDASS